MDASRDHLDDPDYRNGFRDGRMDALLPRTGAQAPDGLSDTYRAGYTAGMESVRPPVYKAA